MVHIKIKKGLNIPIAGKPQGEPKPLILSGEAAIKRVPETIALNLSQFDEMKFKILAKPGDAVKLGQVLVEDKDCPGRNFVSPAGGVVREVRRGLKRRLLDVVIDVKGEEEILKFPLFSLEKTSVEELIRHLMNGGLFTHIRQRPFNFLANPSKLPRSIFVKAVESAPYTPPSEMQVEGYESEFQLGLNALNKIAGGSVHLVYRKNSSSKAFYDAQNVQKHTVEGPHPVANVSLHIERIDRIKSVNDVIWTLDAHAVVAIGFFIMHGYYFVPRIVSIAGSGVIDGQSGYFKVREGYPISDLLAGRVKKGVSRFISGNPLTGSRVEGGDFLGYDDTVICVIPENTKRKFLHFFRLGCEDYTASGAYLTGHLNNEKRSYSFTTSQHGEERPFVDATLYDDVMPLQVPTMPLVKALLAEDYDLASELGLLEVDSEDFALPTFVCPSKIEMGEIVKQGLRKYAADVLS